MTSRYMYTSALTLLGAIISGCASSTHAPYQPPMQSQLAAERISETSLIEVDLNGLGLDNVRWMGVAQYGHGPMQLVAEVPRTSKWLGPTCLKFKNMVRVGDAWTLDTGGYNIVYENVRSEESESYANKPDKERFNKFDRALRISKEDGTWQITALLKPDGTQRIRWINDQGQERSSAGMIQAMKKIQEEPHCQGWL